MGAPQYEQAGADIGGTGTTNTIPRWTGASTLGDSGLIDNGTAIYTTARNVGIGTASPSYRLHLVGSSASTMRLQTPLGTAAYLDWFNVGNAQWGWGIPSDANAFVVTQNGAPGTGSEALRITSTGNVGIGTASPGGRLQVNDTSTTWTTRNIYTGTITAGLGGSIGLGGYWSGTNETVFAYIVGGKDNSTSGDYGGHLQFWTRPNGGAYTERVRIDSNGNIYGTSGTTGMTNGFFYIPAAAGAPTGTPTAVSGRVPMYYDTTNNEFYVYNGAWKKVTLA